MKISIVGLPEIALGKHNVKDPRLDQADQLVEAKKKVYVQLDLISGDEAADADAILCHQDAFPDLLLRDLEFIETRLGRDPQAAEKTLLEKLKQRLEKEACLFDAGLSAEENQIIAAYNFLANKPLLVAGPAEAAAPDALFLKLLQIAGQICFLTVGGKENRAWLIRQGITAWEAAGTIHSDLQKGFIRAEIISFADLIQTGGETQAKRAGKLRLEQKDYVMQDCDVVNFRFSK
jgi:hypothetical protein